ncbi:GGDEF domain-containing protein [Oricola nitratireducens]|uniref:GGDEF domain-containing protein n=1 Tax=Oricola nitratireducens TaxID=2775868 RepID=UPI0018685E83|nr:GGDEF domain-containing protein [Oricola nitratireducens]
MARADRVFEKFKTMPIWCQSCLVTLAAVLGSDSLTLAFYSIFFSDRLALDLLLTALITIIVAFPIAWLFLDQHVKVERLARELRIASQTDSLTRLANRREFMASVGAALSASDEPAGAGAVLFIDADHFKRINDTYGHGVGDEVLINLGEAIMDSIRLQDVAARIGGEEFAVFLRLADLDMAQRVAERIRVLTHKISESMDLGDIGITVSIGIARHRKGQTLDDVLRTADRSLYVAKETGRDRIVQDLCLPAAA